MARVDTSKRESPAAIDTVHSASRTILREFPHWSVGAAGATIRERLIADALHEHSQMRESPSTSLLDAHCLMPCLPRGGARRPPVPVGTRPARAGRGDRRRTGVHSRSRGPSTGHATPQPAGAVFVTLTEAGELRGCIGSMRPDRHPGGGRGRARPSARPSTTRASCRSGQRSCRPSTSTCRSSARPSPWRIPARSRPELTASSSNGMATAPCCCRRWPPNSAGTGARSSAPCVAKRGCRSEPWREAGTRLWRFRTVRFGGPACVRTN